MIKTFRGILADGEQNRIRLSTKKGKIGYKIIKFQTMTADPYAGDAAEHIMKLFKIKQTTVDGHVDFADGNLLAAAIINNHTNGFSDPSIPVIIFDQEVFNQDVYVTHIDTQGAISCNYYLELETFTMSDNAAVVSTLRDIRLNPQVGA
jgi:hypothetical protein